MNIIELQEKLKDLPDQRLTQEMQSPSGSVPQFLVLNELNRRKRMRDDMKAMSAQPTATVAQEAIASAGVPAGGISDMAQMAPRSSIAQNTGIASVAPQPAPSDPSIAQGMYRGGMVRRMYGGGPVRRMQQGGPTSQPVIVKSGITYYLQPDGTYISADGRRRFSDVGTNLSNLASGIMGAIGIPAGGASPPETSIVRDGTVYYLQEDGTYVSSSGDRTLSDIGTNLRNVIPDIRDNIGRITAPSPQATQRFTPPAPESFYQVPAGAIDSPFGMHIPNRQIDDIIASRGDVPNLSDAASAVPTGGPGTFPVPEMGLTLADELAIRRRLFSSEAPPEAQQDIGGLPGYVPTPEAGTLGAMSLVGQLSGGATGTPVRTFRETVDRRDLEAAMRDQPPDRAAAPTMMPQIPNDPGMALPFIGGPVPQSSVMEYMPDPLAAARGPAGGPMTSTGPGMAIPRVGGPVAQVGSTEAPVINPFVLAGSGGVGIDAVMPPMPSRSTGMNYIPDPLARSSGPAGMPMTSRGPAAMAAPPPAPAVPSIPTGIAAGFWDALESPVTAALSGLPYPLADASVSDAAPETQTAPPPDDRTAALDSGAAAEDTISGGAQPSADTQTTAVASQPSGGAGPSGGAASGIAAVAPAATSYEQELINAIQRQEQRAEQDKWLALAQVGLGMMTSRNPTFLGAVGEGGAAGVQALMGARNANEDRRMELVQALEEYRMMMADRAAAEAARRAAASRAAMARRPTQAQALNSIVANMEALSDAMQPYLYEDGTPRQDLDEDEAATLYNLRTQYRTVASMLVPPANLSDAVAQ